jgi:membrane associated rhomboid family serine protease
VQVLSFEKRFDNNKRKTATMAMAMHCVAVSCQCLTIECPRTMKLYFCAACLLLVSATQRYNTCFAYYVPPRGGRLIVTTTTPPIWQATSVRDDRHHFQVCKELTSRRQNYEWDGDDLRLYSRLRRRMKRYIGYGSSSYSSSQPAQKTLLLLNTGMFVYQTINTVQWIAKRYPNYWPSQATSIVWDTLRGSTTMTGPLTRGFLHAPLVSKYQPHRYLTAGFLHGNLLHLLLNMDSQRRVPAWVETGLGRPLYLSTFIVSSVTGNVAHGFLTLNGAGAVAASAATTTCMGASGGICGLYGLMFMALVRMRNGQATTSLFKGMGLLVLYGLLLGGSNTFSNAAHFGGFLGGVTMGLLCGPRYQRNYAARRKWSLEVDNQPQDYRVAMGFGNRPTKGGLIPLSFMWMGIMAAFLLVSADRGCYQAIPTIVLQGLLRPGSLTSSRLY